MPEEQVQDSTSSNPSTTPSITPPNTKSNLVKIIAMCLLLTLFVFGAYLFYTKNDEEPITPVINTAQENTNQTDEIKNEVDKLSSLGIINPANGGNHAKIDNTWKRYTNNELGITFSYPNFVSVKAGPKYVDPRFTSLAVGTDELSMELVVAEDINTDTELLNAYRTLTLGPEYPTSCAIELEKIATKVVGIQQIQGKINTKTEACTTAGYIFFFFYQQETGQIAKWNLGHDANITSDINTGAPNFMIYDWAIVDTFRFRD